ncbi:MAG TPA: glycosyltransferase family 1 protein [Bryobacteraceae bacterium]|nr:glycosyltransferase family 1 protein [Bryobacteraceae bacterium]
MNVALDATPLSVATGGVRRYTEELTRALGLKFPVDRFHLISDQRFRVTREMPGNVSVQAGKTARSLSRRWWTIGLPLELGRLGSDVFHGTDFSVPYLPLRPSVLSLHDLSPWMDPAWHHAAERVRSRTPLLLRLGIATMVITPTEAVRRAAMDRFRLSPSRVVAVPEAASDLFRPVESSPARPYFLYVGTLEPRKNIGVMVSAWRLVRESHDVDLVLAGRQREDFPKLTEEPGLRLTGAVPDEALPVLYSGAVAALYPSLYEGFGLPVLEAMRCGCAVVASKDAAIMEVSGGAALHQDAEDVRGWAAAMTSLLTSRAEWQGRGLRRAAEFTWERTARRTREVYVEAAGRFGG